MLFRHAFTLSCGALIGLAAATPSLAQDAGSPAEPGRRPLEITVTRPHIEGGVPGTATTAIDAADIAKAPALSLPELLAQEPGFQYRDLFGANDGARTTLDLRGFGATGTQNTLILRNGRRLNDIDEAGVEFTNIPLETIRRVEVLRGNSAAVLYGDGAVGGAVNIITGPRRPNGGQVGVAAGTYRLREGLLSAAKSSGNIDLSVDANTKSGVGFRQNNAFTQRGVDAELHRYGNGGEWYISAGVDNQHLGLPGARKVTATSSLLETDPHGATTPNDFADQKGFHAVTGVTRTLDNGGEGVIDAGYRTKTQHSIVISASGPAYDTTTDTQLGTVSFTPRVTYDRTVGGRAASLVGGLDLYYSDYHQTAYEGTKAMPKHQYDLKQSSLAAYGQRQFWVGAATEMSAGIRLQRIDFTGGDILDPTADVSFGGTPFDGHRESERLNDTQWAGNLGLDQHVSDRVTLFGRLGRSFRMPTVDERILSSATYDSFRMNAQTSWDAEAGARWSGDKVSYSVSAFQMTLRNEIHFNSTTFLNENMDPTRRSGVEAGAGVSLTPRLSLKLSGTWMQARFRSGANQGKSVPLVAEWSGSAALTWAVRTNVALTTTLTGTGERWMENDDANVGAHIPGYGIVDVKLSTRQEGWTLSAQVNNALNRTNTFNYAVRSATTITTYNAYPLPGRTMRVAASVQF